MAGAAHPALPAASGLARAARAGGGRPDGREGGWKERSPGRPTRLCLLCSQRWQRRGGRGGQRAQFSAPRSPGNSCGSARPTSGGEGRHRAQIPSEPGAAGGRLAARIPQAGRAVSCGARAGKAGLGRKPCASRWNGPRPRPRRARADRVERWAASVLRVGTTLVRAKANSGGSACNAIGRQRRWSCSSAPPPRCRHRRCRDRPAPSPPSQGHWWGLCPEAR